MQLTYPRSFFRLLLVGFMLAVLPLLVGLLGDRLAIRQLAAQSQKAVYDTARIAHGTRELSDTAVQLERAAQQNVVLHDPALWQGYQELGRRFAGAGARLAQLPLEPELRQLLDDILQREARLRNELMLGNEVLPDALDTAERYALISADTRELLQRSAGLIDREAALLHALASQTEARGERQLLLLLPLALAVVAGFTYLLGRPIGELNQAISDLGERRLAQTIEVHGPEDLQKIGRRLDWLRQRLLHLEEQKSLFLRHVSHELKTPLTALREGSELLAEEVAGPLQDRQREIVRILQQNSVELQRLIETLLRHGEAEFLLKDVQLQTLRPAELIAATVRRQQLAYAARGIRVRLQLADFAMRVDAERLRVVFDNLLSNALKHAPDESTVIVRASVDEAAQQAVIEVIDEGPGVSLEEQERIFEPFYRGQAPAQGTLPGSGLGLAISRDHATAMGGSLGVLQGCGHFVLRLPLGGAGKVGDA